MLVRDHFKVLGVAYDATDEQVRAAYKDLAKKWHPDKNKASGAEEKFKEVLEAYSTLKVKTERQQYIRENVKTSKTDDDSKPFKNNFATSETKRNTTPNESSERKSQANKRDNSKKHKFTDGSHKYHYFSETNDDFSKPGTSKSEKETKSGRNIPRETPKWNKDWNAQNGHRNGFNVDDMSEMAREFMASFMTANMKSEWPPFMPVNITDIPTFRRQFSNFDTSYLPKKQREKFGVWVTNDNDVFYDSSDDEGERDPKISCPHCNKKFVLLELKRHEPICRELRDVTVKERSSMTLLSEQPPHSTGNWRDTHKQVVEGIRKAKKLYNMQTASERATKLSQCFKCKRMLSPESLRQHVCKGRPPQPGPSYRTAPSAAQTKRRLPTDPTKSEAKTSFQKEQTRDTPTNGSYTDPTYSTNRHQSSSQFSRRTNTEDLDDFLISGSSREPRRKPSDPVFMPDSSRFRNGFRISSPLVRRFRDTQPKTSHASSIRSKCQKCHQSIYLCMCHMNDQL